MKNKKACFSKNTDDWKTPTKIYNEYMECGYIDTFPYKAEYDEFEKEYKNQKLFCNPPFSKLNKVADWIIHQVNDNHCTIALLMPARTDTKYFHKLLMLLPDITFIKGRLRFNDSKPAPFPTIVLHFSPFNIIPIYKRYEQ